MCIVKKYDKNINNVLEARVFGFCDVTDANLFIGCWGTELRVWCEIVDRKLAVTKALLVCLSMGAFRFLII